MGLEGESRSGVTFLQCHNFATRVYSCILCVYLFIGLGTSRMVRLHETASAHLRFLAVLAKQNWTPPCLTQSVATSNK